ncbi:MAG: hypothetical protein QM709_12610 [Spongiibacteraceae bacterium]
MSDEALKTRKQALQPQLDQVRDELRRQLAKNGIEFAFSGIPADLSYCELRKDPFDNSEPFYGEWHDAAGKKLGEITVHASGEFFAEVDVLQGHPTDKRWYVEAVTAWGKPGMVKSELRLLAALPA